MSNATPPSPPAGLPATLAPADNPVVTARRPRAVRPTIRQVLLDRHRLDGWTAIKVAAFIEVLGDTGSVSRAAAYVSMSPSSAYRLRNRPGAELFAEAWEAAIGARHEMLADIAMSRITDGVERNRWWRGDLVGRDQVFSDRLLMFMLSATNPDRARRGGISPARPGADVAAAAGLGAASPGFAGYLPDAPPGPRAELGGPLARGGAGPACAADWVGDCPEGECAACDALQPSACEVYDAALAEETALPLDVEAEVEAQRARRAAAKAADDAEIAAIGAMFDGALGRVPPGENDSASV